MSKIAVKQSQSTKYKVVKHNSCLFHVINADSNLIIKTYYAVIKTEAHIKGAYNTKHAQES